MTTLAPLTPEHYETAARWLSNPAINRWLSGEWRDKEIAPTILAVAVRNRKNRFFLISFDGQPCGLVALSDVDAADKTAMAWYLLGEQQLQGKGITSEAVKQLIATAFVEMGLESLYAWAAEGNSPSLKLLRKVGFREVGRIRRSACVAGQQLDRIYFDVTKEDLRRSP